MGRSSRDLYSSLLFFVCVLILPATSACRSMEKLLVGQYKLTFMSRREIRIWRPDRYVDHSPSPAVMLAGNVQRYAVRDP
jgi:hypothetical protein